MTNGPLEPRADLRQAAAELMQWFQAMLQEGFTEEQALTIIGKMIGRSDK